MPETGLEAPRSAADRGSVPALPARLRREDAFGLIELTFAMLILNIAILALVGSFNAGALALDRSAAISNGSTVADKVMEVYRDLPNDAIYLAAGTTPSCNTGGSDSGGWPAGIPNSSSVWYSQYTGNVAAFTGTWDKGDGNGP